MPTQIQLRRDTAADWTSNNPTLAAGELGYETDTTKFKVGDGTTAWTGLAYNTSAGGATINNQAENRLTTIGSTTTELDGEANLTFDGSTLTLTGTAALDGVTITDNSISTNRSNDSLQITANGTGRIDVSANGTYLSTSNAHYSKWWGADSRIKGLAMNYVNDSVNADTTDREYGAAFAVGNTLTAGSSSNSDWRPRALIADSNVDMAGQDYTRTGSSRGPQAFLASARAYNSSGSSASQISSVRGIQGNAAIADYSGTASQNITIDNATGVNGVVAIEGNGTSDMLISTGKAFTAEAYVDYAGSGSAAITDFYAYHTPGTGATNNYAFVSDSATAVSKIGTLAQYREEINTLTSSSTITVDCGLAPVHTVTLGTNTGFVITNLGTGQSVTLIITQDGTGSRTATFGTDTSTAVKFAGGAPTLSTGNGDIDIVTIFNDGTNYYGSCAKDFS